MDLIEIYKNQTFYEIMLCGLVRRLPIRQVDKEMWIASNHQLVLSDVKFIERVSKELANRISVKKPDCLVTAESKSLPLVYEIAKKLRHKEVAVARKDLKAYMNECIVEEVKSITTTTPQKLFLDKENIERIRTKRVCIVDDVVSTGKTFNALKNLVSRTKGKVECEAAVWLEGPWYKGDLIYLSTLPVFVTKEKYKSFEVTPL